MQAIEFETNIHDGVVKIPPHYQSFTSKNKAKVIILFEDSTPSTDEDFIAYLCQNPVKDHGPFLSREEANER